MIDNTNLKSSEKDIKVIGLGGAGCNTVDRLFSLDLNDVELIAANTDKQSLLSTRAHKKIILGPDLTGGLGSGGNPLIGQKAAEESFRELISAIKGSRLVFLTAGMGGGTGSGAIQIAAGIAKSLDVLTISVVSLPFSFESGIRSRHALEYAFRLQPFTDTLITIPNDRLLNDDISSQPISRAFASSDDYLAKGIQGLSGLVNSESTMGIDFSHIIRLMTTKGGTYISIGFGEGSSRVIQALDQAFNHPLVGDISIRESAGIVIKFRGNITLTELNQGVAHIRSRISPETELIPVVSEEKLSNNRVEAFVLAAGIGAVPIHAEYIPETTVNYEDDKLPVIQSDPVGQFDYVQAESDLDNLEVPAFIRKGYNLAGSI